MVGRKIGQFQIVEELGVGGMGTVYKARDTRLNRYVAIKALHPHVLRDSQAYRRFKNEAQISAQLSNPNVATLYDFIKEADHSYLIMEYIDGITIEKKLKDEGALSVKETIGLTKQILRGLSEAHRLNILHRDLKPANVMLKAGNYAKLMDFGIARLENATRLTANNKVIGTVEYMAPELLKGKEPSKASDLYAVGVIIHEMLTGKTLFVANSEAALVYSIVNEKPEIDLSGVPQQLRRIVKKLTHKSPQNRYRSTDEVLKDLEKITDLKAEKGRTAVSLPSLPIKWPPGFTLNRVGSVGEKVTNWSGQWRINRRTKLVLLASVIVSLVILFAGSFLQPEVAKTTEPSFEPEPTDLLDSEVRVASEEASYTNPVRTRSEIQTPFPAASGQPPVTIEKKPVEPEISQPRKREATPAPERTPPSAPVNISRSTSNTEKTPVEKEKSATDESEARPVQEIAEQEKTKEKTVPNKETIEKQPAPLNTGKEVAIIIPQQYLPVVFGRTVSSANLPEGQVVYLKADDRVVVDGATAIAKGARVRAVVKTNTIKKNGKTEFSIAIEAVESTAKKWVELTYPEYSLIQEGVILFPADTRLSRVKVKTQSTTILKNQ